VPEGNVLISVVAFHFLAGSITGSMFAVRTLLTLVALVLIECVAVTIAWGVSTGLWSLGSLIAVQMGYLGGIYFRSVLEHAGVAEPNVRPRRRP
jgi:hypothetical protein